MGDHQDRESAGCAGIPCGHSAPKQVYLFEYVWGNDQSGESSSTSKVCGTKPSSEAQRGRVKAD